MVKNSATFFAPVRRDLFYIFFVLVGPWAPLRAKTRRRQMIAPGGFPFIQFVNNAPVGCGTGKV